MKPGIHPDYRYVVFKDTSSGDTILTKSTIVTAETITWTDGNEYPLAKVEISAFTHPFFTGQMKIVDTAGRVERFEKRYGRRRKSPVAETAGDAVEAAEVDETPAAEVVEAPAEAVAEAPAEDAAEVPAEADEAASASDAEASSESE